MTYWGCKIVYLLGRKNDYGIVTIALCIELPTYLECYENQEELQPYFSLSRVMDGLFNLVNMLFGINLEPADGLAPVWNHDVRFYLVNDSSLIPIAYFYFDPYSHPFEKSGGAWMGGVVGRSRILSRDDANARLTVVHIVCNQMPPVGDKPSLMTFHEVENVYHEFGLALQHMVTKQDEVLVAGIRGIEWDAMELPSRFMQNRCYHRYELEKHIPDLHVLISTPFHPAYVTADRINKAKNLQLLPTAGIGSDHVDLKAAVAAGLTVAEVTGSNTVSVAEDELMRILILVRNFLPCRTYWQTFTPTIEVILLQEQYEKSAAGRAARAQMTASAKQTTNPNQGEPVLKLSVMRFTLEARTSNEAWNIAAIIPVDKIMGSGNGGGRNGSSSSELIAEENFLEICSRE
ncbi:hypothetical protein FXO38_35825 [Capsicum annuum]|uniref:oligopeptidase A n=1 Tax=Capsicum annuum TaxID=4072 RepID=A0A2G2Z3J9_CAPAN|nr:hypothetical protein FXO38_35825 [Capsicum annuum]PHT76566.1 hypothetical protein T459_20088 [Capsicum annuum]